MEGAQWNEELVAPEVRVGPRVVHERGDEHATGEVHDNLEQINLRHKSRSQCRGYSNNVFKQACPSMRPERALTLFINKLDPVNIPTKSKTKHARAKLIAAWGTNQH